MIWSHPGGALTVLTDAWYRTVICARFSKPPAGAPSSYNEQPWHYIIARRQDEEPFSRLLSCLNEGNRLWARSASVLALGVTALKLKRNNQPNRSALHDLGLASATLLFEATARGLCVHQMIGILPDRARELYAVPPDYEILTGLAIGYPAGPEALPEQLREKRSCPASAPPVKGVFARRCMEPGGGYCSLAFRLDTPDWLNAYPDGRWFSA